MSNILPIANSIETIQVSTITTSQVKLKGARFDFDNNIGSMVVSYGDLDATTGEFVEFKTEVWSLSGAYYNNKVALAPTEVDRRSDLFKFLADILVEITSDSALKQSLIDSGELKITD